MFISLVFWFGVLQTVAEETKQDSRLVLSKAADLVDLQSRGSPPFLMLAKVILSEGKKSVEGTYAIAWATPEQFRRVFRFPNFTSIEVATEGVMYRQRSMEALPLLVWEASELLTPAASYKLDSKWKIRELRRENAGALKLTCVIAQANVSETKLCANEETGEPSSIDRGTTARGLESMREHIEFADYQPFEGKTFPRKLVFRGWNSHIAEIQIQKLLHPQSFAADEFTPPKGASRTQYCESPETSGEVRPSARGTVPIGFKNIETAMYFQVSPQGGVQYAQVVYSSDPLENDEILHWFIGTHFPIKTCAGTPVGYETVIRLATGH